MSNFIQMAKPIRPDIDIDNCQPISSINSTIFNRPEFEKTTTATVAPSIPSSLHWGRVHGRKEKHQPMEPSYEHLPSEALGWRDSTKGRQRNIRPPSIFTTIPQPQSQPQITPASGVIRCISFNSSAVEKSGSSEKTPDGHFNSNIKAGTNVYDSGKQTVLAETRAGFACTSQSHSYINKDDRMDATNVTARNSFPNPEKNRLPTKDNVEDKPSNRRSINNLTGKNKTNIASDQMSINERLRIGHKDKANIQKDKLHSLSFNAVDLNNADDTSSNEGDNLRRNLNCQPFALLGNCNNASSTMCDDNDYVSIFFGGKIVTTTPSFKSVVNQSPIAPSRGQIIHSVPSPSLKVKEAAVNVSRKVQGLIQRDDSNFSHSDEIDGNVDADDSSDESKWHTPDINLSRTDRYGSKPVDTLVKPSSPSSKTSWQGLHMPQDHTYETPYTSEQHQPLSALSVMDLYDSGIANCTALPNGNTDAEKENSDRMLGNSITNQSGDDVCKQNTFVPEMEFVKTNRPCDYPNIFTNANQSPRLDCLQSSVHYCQSSSCRCIGDTKMSTNSNFKLSTAHPQTTSAFVSDCKNKETTPYIDYASAVTSTCPCHSDRDECCHSKSQSPSSFMQQIHMHVLPSRFADVFDTPSSHPSPSLNHSPYYQNSTSSLEKKYAKMEEQKSPNTFLLTPEMAIGQCLTSTFARTNPNGKASCSSLFTNSSFHSCRSSIGEFQNLPEISQPQTHPFLSPIAAVNNSGHVSSSSVPSSPNTKSNSFLHSPTSSFSYTHSQSQGRIPASPSAQFSGTPSSTTAANTWKTTSNDYEFHSNLSAGLGLNDNKSRSDYNVNSDRHAVAKAQVKIPENETNTFFKTGNNDNNSGRKRVYGSWNNSFKCRSGSRSEKTNALGGSAQHFLKEVHTVSPLVSLSTNCFETPMIHASYASLEDTNSLGDNSEDRCSTFEWSEIDTADGQGDVNKKHKHIKKNGTCFSIINDRHEKLASDNPKLNGMERKDTGDVHRRVSNSIFREDAEEKSANAIERDFSPSSSSSRRNVLFPRPSLIPYWPSNFNLNFVKKIREYRMRKLEKVE